MISLRSASTTPVEAVTPHTPQLLVTSITAALVVAALTYTLVVWRRRGTPLYLLILLGGCLAILNEAALDLVSQIYFPSEDAWVAFEAYGRTMPIWAVLSYTLYFGAVFLRAGPFFTGPMTLLAVAVPPLGQLLALWVGTPHFLLLNSDASLAAKTVASLVSVLIGLVAIDIIGRIACQGERRESLGSTSMAVGGEQASRPETARAR